MFAHPLTSFWTHLEASNCHIVKNKKLCFSKEIPKSRIFHIFSLVKQSYGSGGNASLALSVTGGSKTAKLLEVDLKVGMSCQCSMK